MQDFFDLTGKVALVTGGSRGLGYEIVKGLARAGADIVVTSRKIEPCQQVAREVESLGRNALAHACHVGRWQDIEGLVDAAYRQFGKIDILVNNAGMSPVVESSVEVTEELFDKIVAINFKGPFRLSSIVGARMAADGGGSIINISSFGALLPLPSYATYAGAKAALNAVTQAHAHEFGAAGVRVNAILPGTFRTDMSKDWPKEKEDNMQGAMRRYGEPGEIVSTVLYLASDHSSYTTGATIRVDGGRIA